MTTNLPSTPEPLSPRLEQLRQKVAENRANCVSEIFAIYDKIPEILAEFKLENISEDEMVQRLGMLIEHVLADFEMTQVPLILATIQERNKANVIDKALQQSSIIDPSTGQAAIKTDIEPSSRLIVP